MLLPERSKSTGRSNNRGERSSDPGSLAFKKLLAEDWIARIFSTTAPPSLSENLTLRARSHKSYVLPLDNPYKAAPGADLDSQIHQFFFPNESSGPAPYSTDDKAAEKLRGRLKTLYRYPIVTGHTNTRPRQYYARFESGPSTSTEVLADTFPLAICRLALIVSTKHDPATH